MRDRSLEGRRVKLVCCNDPYTRLSPGELGTVMIIDDVGTLHVCWDDGSNLGLQAEYGDRWQLLPEGEQ